MPKMIDIAHPTARKEHICQFCGCKIQPGQKYERQTNVFEGQIYDFVNHEECSDVAHELSMYDDCDDCGLDGETFREELDEYVHANHYDDEADDISEDWQLSHYEIAKKVLEELNEKQKRKNNNGQQY